MKALILNSGIGKRMGEFTTTHNKCMAQIAPGVAIIDWQLQLLQRIGITEVVITTGPFADALQEHVISHYPEIHLTFRHNPVYDKTNYIYSIALAADELRQQDILLLHGDLVFEESVLRDIAESESSAMVVDKSLPLPEKDFKAVVQQGKITKVGIEYFTDAYAAQPLYKLLKDDWNLWLDQIVNFCDRGERNVYAENALNEVSDRVCIKPFDVNQRICTEVDNLDDLERVQTMMKEIVESKRQ